MPKLTLPFKLSEFAEKEIARQFDEAIGRAVKEHVPTREIEIGRGLLRALIGDGVDKLSDVEVIMEVGKLDEDYTQLDWCGWSKDKY